MLTKMPVEFFDNPPTIGDIHQNQIFKFIDNFPKFSKATNKVSDISSSYLGRIRILHKYLKFKLTEQEYSEDNSILFFGQSNMCSDLHGWIDAPFYHRLMNSSANPNNLFRNCNTESSKRSSTYHTRNE